MQGFDTDILPEYLHQYRQLPDGLAKTSDDFLAKRRIIDCYEEQFSKIGMHGMGSAMFALYRRCQELEGAVRENVPLELRMRLHNRLVKCWAGRSNVRGQHHHSGLQRAGVCPRMPGKRLPRGHPSRVRSDRGRQWIVSRRARWLSSEIPRRAGLTFLASIARSDSQERRTRALARLTRFSSALNSDSTVTDRWLDGLWKPYGPIPGSAS